MIGNKKTIKIDAPVTQRFLNLKLSLITFFFNKVIKYGCLRNLRFVDKWFFYWEFNYYLISFTCFEEVGNFDLHVFNQIDLRHCDIPIFIQTLD